MLYTDRPRGYGGLTFTTRDIVDIARTTVANFEPDALCVSGAAAGSEADIATMKRIKEAMPDSVVLANNGVKATNVLDSQSSGWRRRWHYIQV